MRANNFAAKLVWSKMDLRIIRVYGDIIVFESEKKFMQVFSVVSRQWTQVRVLCTLRVEVPVTGGAVTEYMKE
jgi:hypothetical protein